MAHIFPCGAHGQKRILRADDRFEVDAGSERWIFFTKPHGSSRLITLVRGVNDTSGPYLLSASGVRENSPAMQRVIKTDGAHRKNAMRPVLLAGYKSRENLRCEQAAIAIWVADVNYRFCKAIRIAAEPAVTVLRLLADR